MFAFFDYIRNITYYLMFATVVGMLAPTGKYKKFVSLVMGFILLSMMIQPLARFTTQVPVTDWFGALAPHGQTNDWENSYEHWRNTYLRTAFEAQLTTQLTALLTQNNFTVHNAIFTFADDFSAIYTTRVTISQREEETTRVPFIRIQPPQPIRVGNHSQEPEPLPCPTATAAKNLISQFYNLPLAHIYVTVVP